MSKRCYFLIPDATKPTGGVNVIFRFVEVLRTAGIDAVALQQSPRHRYEYADVAGVPVLYTHLLRRWQARRGSGKSGRGLYRRSYRRMREQARFLAERAHRDGVAEADLQEGDVLVVPEVMFASAWEAFPRHLKKVLLVQGHFLLFDRWVKQLRTGLPIPDYAAYIATSRACEAACRALGGAPVFHVPLSVEVPLNVASSMGKRRQIAYMPQKRPDESQLIVELLRRRSRMEDFEFVPIDGLVKRDVASILSESLIFLSIGYREGFGLPAAEAMLSECIVIGYTGQGGDEFFDEDTGIPVEEFQPLRYVEAVEGVIAEYKREPDRLDRMRKAACRRIKVRYGKEGMERALLAASDDLFGECRTGVGVVAS